jgi:glycosyltransferase involved in cell wall biosynthesis
MTPVPPVEPPAAAPPAAARRVEVSVVMPCLNEEETIAACIDRAHEGLRRLGATGEVIVADNGSTDRSVAIAEARGARVVHVAPRGYGHAYRAGIAAAAGEIVVMGDSDNTYDFSRLDELVRPLHQGADLVMGSRLTGSIERGAMPWLHRYFGTPALTAILNRFFGTSLVDTLSGFRAFRRSLYDTLGLKCGGMEWGSEMLVAAARRRLRIVEVPIEYGARLGESKLRTFRDGWRYLMMMLIYSPTHLFTVPGVACTTVGIVLLLALLPGPIRAGRLYFDFHYMFLGSLLTILGSQLITVGVFARSHHGDRTWLTRGRGLAIGLALFTLGLAGNAHILWRWIAADFGPMNQVRPAILALTLMVVGAQLVFSSMYLALLRLGQDV